MMTIDQWSAFLFKAQDKAFIEQRDNTPVTYTAYTREGNMKNADYRDVTAVGLGPAGYTPLGGQAHLDEYQAGTELVIKPKKLTIAVITPEELEEDMLNNGRIDEDKAKIFSDMATDTADAHTWAFEVLCTDFQLRGTSTTPTAFWQGAGRDGLALFSTSHVTSKGVPVTWSNRQTTGPLNAVTLAEGVTMLENIPNEAGRPQSSIKRIGIVYGRYHSWRIPELLKATSQPDTANLGNPNILGKGVRYDNIQFVPILNTFLGPTETSWMLIDLDRNPLMHFMKSKPKNNRDVEPRTGNNIFRTRSRFATGFSSARGALLNAGQ